MKLLMPIGIAVSVAGVAAFGVLKNLGVARPEPWAAALLGTGFLLMGLDGVVTGRTTTGWSKGSLTHRGASARLRGGFFAFLGIVVAAVSLSDALGMVRTSELLDGARGLGITLVVAAVSGIFGSGILFAEASGRPLYRALPARGLGALLLLASLVALATGLVFALQPSVAEGWLRQLRAGRGLEP